MALVPRDIPGWVYIAVALFWSATVGTDLLSFELDPPAPELGILLGHFLFKHSMIAAFWAVVSVLALAFYAERPMLAGGLAGAIARTTVLAAAFAMLYAAYFVGLLLIVTRGELEWSTALRSARSHSLLYGFITSLEIAVVANAYHYYRRSLRRQRQSEQLQLRLAETEVALLRAKLEPHFLFNALNSISALVHLGRNDQASAAISHLATLLRGMLEVGQRSVMPWEWEERFTETYMELQKLRFGARLGLTIEAEGVRRDVGVPACLLQPLIENAIRHGPLDQDEACEIQATLQSRGDRLRLRVTNAIGAVSALGSGVGLGNIEARLRAIYGDDFHFEAGRSGDEFVVTADFPEVEA